MVNKNDFFPTFFQSCKSYEDEVNDRYFIAMVMVKLRYFHGFSDDRSKYENYSDITFAVDMVF